MPTQIELREKARQCREEGVNEPVLEKKRALYRMALALTDTAEQLARDEAAGLSQSRRRINTRWLAR